MAEMGLTVSKSRPPNLPHLISILLPSCFLTVRLFLTLSPDFTRWHLSVPQLWAMWLPLWSISLLVPGVEAGRIQLSILCSQLWGLLAP